MKIKTLCVGPIGTNCYILCDEAAGVCALIDPGGDAAAVSAAVAETGCCLLYTSPPVVQEGAQGGEHCQRPLRL